jgi:hypothetical protein
VGVTLLIALAPYALWALFAQNILEQPRHLLPLVVALILGLALLVEQHRALGLGMALALFGSSAPLGQSRATVAPPAVQLARYLAHTQPLAHLALFGGRSIRLVRLVEPTIDTRERTWLSEVDVDLERFDVLPRSVWVTSEVTPTPDRLERLRPGPWFCRDPRLDRQAPCLQLLEYQIPHPAMPVAPSH